MGGPAASEAVRIESGKWDGGGLPSASASCMSSCGGVPWRLRTCGGMNLARYSVGWIPGVCRKTIFASEGLDGGPGKDRLLLILRDVPVVEQSRCLFVFPP